MWESQRELAKKIGQRRMEDECEWLVLEYWGIAFFLSEETGSSQVSLARAVLVVLTNV